MKRKWILAVAVLPLVIGLIVAERLSDKHPRVVVAKPLADKRPRVVVHLTTSVPVGGGTKRIYATELFMSPDGKKLFVRYNSERFGQIIALDTGSVTQLPDSNGNYNVFFSTDSRNLYQMEGYSPAPSAKEISGREAFSLRDARTGALKSRFVDFKPTGLILTGEGALYGAALHQKRIVLGLGERTIFLDPGNLQILGTNRNKGVFKNDGWLCAGGEIFYSHSATQAVDFFDLQTKKLLWQLPLNADWKFAISSDGHLVVTPERGFVVARDLRTGQEKWRFRGPRSQVLTVTPDQSAIYEARESGELWKWPR